MPADNEFALKTLRASLCVGKGKRHRFERCPGIFFAQIVTPRNVKAAIGALEIGNFHTPRTQPRYPGSIRTELRPTRATQRQDRCTWPDRHFTFRIFQTQAAVGIPSQPAMTNVEAHPGVAQPVQPSAQQGRGLHFPGKNPAGCADKGFDAQTMHPGTQRLRRKAVKQGLKLRTALAIAGTEGVVVLAMSDVQAADTGTQEFPSGRGHGVVNRHRPAGKCECLGSHQPCRTGPDNGDFLKCFNFHVQSASFQRSVLRNYPAKPITDGPQSPASPTISARF